MHNTAARKIIHIDMDAFFASCEQRDDPNLRGRPVAVGGGSERGVVAAASYEARAFGVRSAMASAQARRLCPDLIFVPHRFDIYKEVSAQIRAIFLKFTPVVQPLSLDEAYLDVTENLTNEPSATRIAQAIRQEIMATTRLTASAGVSYNKFLAKIASDMNKPDGLYVIRPEQGAAFVATLPVRKFHGVGPVTATRMARLGITTGQELRAQSRTVLDHHFGKSAHYYYWAARGIDDRPVNPDQRRKSVGAETTFGVNLDSANDCRAALSPLIAKVARQCAASEIAGRTITLKLRYADFTTVTRSHTADRPTASATGMEPMVAALLAMLCPLSKGVRLLGVSLSNLHHIASQEQVIDPQGALL